MSEFNQNNRFAALLDNSCNNVYKQDNHSQLNRGYSRFSRRSSRFKTVKESINIDVNDKMSFPSLHGTVIKDKKTTNEEEDNIQIDNYAEKIRINEYIDTGIPVPQTNNIVKALKRTNDHNNYQYVANKVFNRLTELYEKDTAEKIDIYGEEAYERYFKFQNYDYNYFDYLDQDYYTRFKEEINIENSLLYNHFDD